MILASNVTCVNIREAQHVRRYTGCMNGSEIRPAKAYHHGDLHSALIRQAVKLIRKRGDVNFSLRDLAAEIGVSHAAVYRHFNGKAALLAAVAVHGFELLAKAVEAAGAPLNEQPAEQLAQQGAAYVGMATRYPGHFAAMFAPEIHHSAQAAEVLAAAESAYLPLLRTVMRRLACDDPTAPAVQAEALRCWALVHGVASLQLSGNLAACLGPSMQLTTPAQVQALVLRLLGSSTRAPAAVRKAARTTASG